MLRTLASILLLTQAALIAGPAMHSHAAEEGTASCPTATAEHVGHTLVTSGADGLIQAPQECEHCGVPECGVMLNCTGLTFAAVQTPQTIEVPAVVAVAETPASVSPRSSSVSPILPPPRA